MNPLKITELRQANQHLCLPALSTPAELTGWMGAVQAQDFPMAKWALGIRLKGLQERDIDDALNEGSVLRTHVLRPTWHLVTRENIRWMLSLSSARINASMKARNIELELGEKVREKCNDLILKALAGGNHMSREELASMFMAAGIKTDQNRLSHILMNTETESLICSGRVNGSRHTYALLDERVPEKSNLTKEESLARLFTIYFKSHGPATLRDFTWWSGLAAKDIRAAEALAGSNFEKVSVDDAVYYLPESRIPEVSSTFLLPAFDEYIIGYTDRSAVLSLVHNRKAVSDNGVFRPIVVINGQVAGIWKRSVKKDTLVIDVTLFGKVTRKERKSIESSATEYRDFLKMKEVIVNQITHPLPLSASKEG